MPSTVAIIQIDDSSDKIIEGTWQFDKSNGGTLVPPFVTGSLPVSGMLNEVVISGTTMFRWSGSGWIPLTQQGGFGDSGAQYLLLASTSSLPNERTLVLALGLSGSDGGPQGPYTLGTDFRQVAFINDNGPFETQNVSTSTYKTIVGGNFPTTVSWYTDVAKTKFLQRKTLVRNAQQNPTTINWFLYAADGVTVIRQFQETITYSGVNETGRTRARIL